MDSPNQTTKSNPQPEIAISEMDIYRNISDRIAYSWLVAIIFATTRDTTELQLFL